MIAASAASRKDLGSELRTLRRRVRAIMLQIGPRPGKVDWARATKERRCCSRSMRRWLEWSDISTLTLPRG